MNTTSEFNAKLFPSVKLTGDFQLPGFTLHPQEVVQLVAPQETQEELIECWLFADGKQEPLQGLGQEVGFILNGMGLIANLSIKENIMLPLLYHRKANINSSLDTLSPWLEELQLQQKLGNLAGLQSARVNSEVSLCRCILQKATYIIMQQPQSSMSKNEAKQFTQLVLKAVDALQAGVVYLTSSANDCGGFKANKQIYIQQQENVS